MYVNKKADFDDLYIENLFILVGLSHEEALRADIVHTIPSHVGTVIVQLAGQKSSFSKTFL